MEKKQPENGELREGLRRLLVAIEASGRAVFPSSNLELLQSIVDAAARIFGAAAASISLVDREGHELAFKVAYGVGREDVVGRRIPLGKGIAGYVAMTGQPISISDVQRDPRFLQDFARSTGYVPSSILAMPLIYGDQVIGVMQVLDKISAPSFGMQDMELLGVFAQQAAIAIDQSQQYEHLDQALVHGIKRVLASDPGRPSDDLTRELEEVMAQNAPEKSMLINLATFFYDISSLGEAEGKMCLEIMSAIREYMRGRPKFFKR
jgi:transcriptional regulator with GAF, ATPase, and Fis domain